MVAVERDQRVVEGNDKGAVSRSRTELFREPGLLAGLDATTVGDVGIGADDCCERRVQSPVNVGQSCGLARGVA